MSDITDRLFLAWERGEDITVPWPTTLLLDARTHIETLDQQLAAQARYHEVAIGTLRDSNDKLEAELAALREAITHPVITIERFELKSPDDGFAWRLCINGNPIPLQTGYSISHSIDEPTAYECSLIVDGEKIRILD